MSASKPVGLLRIINDFLRGNNITAVDTKDLDNLVHYIAGEEVELTQSNFREVNEYLERKQSDVGDSSLKVTILYAFSTEDYSIVSIGVGSVGLTCVFSRNEFGANLEGYAINDWSLNDWSLTKGKLNIVDISYETDYPLTYNEVIYKEDDEKTLVTIGIRDDKVTLVLNTDRTLEKVL